MANPIFRVLRGSKDMNPDAKIDMLDKMLAVYDAKLQNLEKFVHSPTTALPRTSFTSDIPPSEASILKLSVRKRLKMMPTMLSLMWNMWRSSTFYKRSFQPTMEEAPEGWSEELVRLAKKWGASDIRFVKVPERAMFKHLGVPYEYAIVFTIEMDNEPIKTAPSYEAFVEVAKGYRKLAIISNRLTRWMRGHGAAAYPGTALGGLSDYTHIAEQAGLGAIGYHGLLISPQEGARLRINTIYTNIPNLPLQQENPHLWVRDFCSKCHKCIRKCPVDAIFEEPKPRPGGGMQCIDHKTCRDYFAANFGCGICLKVCPFSQAGYDKIKESFKGAPEAPVFTLEGLRIGPDEHKQHPHS